MSVATPTKREANARSAGNDKPTPAAVDKQALIDGLNHDLAGEYQAIVMYIQYSAKLTGPYRRELRPSSRPRLRTSRDTLSSWRTRSPAWAANRRPSRGNTPRRPAEGNAGARAGGRETSDRRLRPAAPPGGGFGDVGLKVSLENQVADETRHKEEIERVLAGWDER